MRKDTISVEGMTCGHCKSSVEEAVGKLEGVETVTADVDNNQVTIAFNDQKVDLAKVAEEIEDVGFDVKQ
ncbi:copper ion binding protein [Salsuginibacillus kocurii]|uniref:copper ion binding protein n=1 Tax=Salsuginibacillus kocurii TaxID=427078 RepID=UPI00037FDF6D|nr:copper ion binding protein [Salsuginibacillus kocurii]